MDVANAGIIYDHVSSHPREFSGFLHYRSDDLSSHGVQLVLGRDVATALAVWNSGYHRRLRFCRQHNTQRDC